MHNVYYAYNLKKCLSGENTVVTLDEIQRLALVVKKPMEVLNHGAEQLKHNGITIFKSGRTHVKAMSLLRN